jgi:hypothetical protein
MRVRYWFFSQKYRFDLGLQVMTLVNFALLVLTFRKSYDLPLWVVPLAFPVVLLCIWGAGYFLDRVGRSQEKNEEIMVERSPRLNAHYEEQSRILNKLDEIIKSIKPQ